MSKLMMGLDLGSRIIGQGYNIFAGERNRKDYLKQQSFQNRFMADSRDNAMQIRRKDLEAAGLHPTLAAGSPASGGTPTVGAAGGTQLEKQGSVLESALLTANIDNIKAQTARTRKQTELDERETAVREQQLGLNQMGEGRAQDLHPNYRKKLEQEITKIAEEHMLVHYKGLHEVDRNKLTLLQNEAARMLNQYMLAHQMHMPTRSNDMQELEALFKALGLDSSSAGRATKAVFTVIQSILGRRRPTNISPTHNVNIPASK